MKWLNIYCCINISLTKNVLEHVHLEDKFVKNQRLIAGWHSISFSHILVASKCICLSKLSVHRLQWGCIEQPFLVSKVNGHWIMLRLCPSHGHSESLGVNGAVGSPERWPSAWWLEGLRKTWVAVWLTAILNYKTSLEHSLVLSPLVAISLCLISFW